MNVYKVYLGKNDKICITSEIDADNKLKLHKIRQKYKHEKEVMVNMSQCTYVYNCCHVIDTLQYRGMLSWVRACVMRCVRGAVMLIVRLFS